MNTHRIHIANVAAEISCREDQTILQAAVAAGIDFPYACTTGNCGVCICRLEAGAVAMLPRSDNSLTPAQARAGMTLGCRAQPRTDLVLRWLGRTPP